MPHQEACKGHQDQDEFGIVLVARAFRFNSKVVLLRKLLKQPVQIVQHHPKLLVLIVLLKVLLIDFTQLIVSRLWTLEAAPVIAKHLTVSNESPVPLGLLNLEVVLHGREMAVIMNGFEVGSAGDGLDLFVVLPPVLQAVDLYFGRIEVDAQHFLLLQIALLAGKTANSLVLLHAHQVLELLQGLFLLINNLALLQIFLLLHLVLLALLIVVEIDRNGPTYLLSLLEVLYDLKAQRRDFSQSPRKLLIQTTCSCSSDSVYLLQHLSLEKFLLQHLISLDQSPQKDQTQLHLLDNFFVLLLFDGENALDYEVNNFFSGPVLLTDVLKRLIGFRKCLYKFYEPSQFFIILNLEDLGNFKVICQIPGGLYIVLGAEGQNLYQLLADVFQSSLFRLFHLLKHELHWLLALACILDVHLILIPHSVLQV